MISIFQARRSGAVSKEEAQALGNLTTAIRENLIKARGLNHKELAASLIALAEAVGKKEERETLQEVSGKACGDIEQYFLQLGKSIDTIGTDLATSIRALATLLHGASDTQEQFLDRMDGLRDKFQAGRTLNSIEQMRAHLDACLTALRSELFHARAAHNEHKAATLEQMSHLHRSVSSLRTAVPQKHAAGPALSILRVRRLKAIRDRYGDAVAQKLVDHVVQILLVRWPAAYDITPYGDECLVVVDSTNLDLDFHRSALRKLTGEKHTFTFTHEGKEVALPLALDWTVIRAPADGDMEEFIQNFLEGMAQKDTQIAQLDQALGASH
jgi:GGDEF domain-containing protein